VRVFDKGVVEADSAVQIQELRAKIGELPLALRDDDLL
jgi:hypothetical protein